MLQLFKKIFFNKHFTKLGIYGFGQLFNLVTPLLVIPYIISVCGEENFGKSSIAMALGFFLMVFIDYGSDIVGVRTVSLHRNNILKLQKFFFSTYYTKIFLLFSVLLTSVILFSVIPFFYNEKQLFFLGITILVGQFLNPTWFLQGIENVLWITISNILSKIIYVICIFVFIQQKSDYVFINLFWGLGMILSNGLFLVLVIKKHNFKFIKFQKHEVISFLKRDFKMFSSQIFVSLQMYAPIVLISVFGTNLMAGQFKIVEQVVVIFKTYILVFFNFVYPKICYLIHSNPKKAILNWKYYNGTNFVFITISMILVYTFSLEIITYFNSSNAFLLSKLLQIAVIYPVLITISIPLKQLVLAWNHNQNYALITTISVIVNIIAMIILIPIYKVQGVFISLIIIEAFVILFYLICIHKNWVQNISNDKEFI